MKHAMYRVPLETAGGLWLMAAPPPGDLAEVMAQFEKLGIVRVVSLLATEEAEALGLADEASVCRGRGIRFAPFPIADFSVPKLAGFDLLVRDIAADLKAGQSVVVHCRAGIGRTGTLASCVVQALGHPAAKAMTMVANARGSTIPDTEAQRRFIEAFGQRL